MTLTGLCQKNPNTIPAAAASSPCPGRTVVLRCQPGTASTASASSAEARHCLNTGSQSLAPPLEAYGGVLKGSPFLSSLQVGMLKH